MCLGFTSRLLFAAINHLFIIFVSVQLQANLELLGLPARDQCRRQKLHACHFVRRPVEEFEFEFKRRTQGGFGQTGGHPLRGGIAIANGGCQFPVKISRSPIIDQSQRGQF